MSEAPPGLAMRDGRSPMPLAQKVLVSDIDNTLLGDAVRLRELIAWLQRHGREVVFGIATGRTLGSAVSILEQWQVPLPDVLITSVGSEIHYGPGLVKDTRWVEHIEQHWRRDDLQQVLSAIPGLELQERENQREFKLSYYVRPEQMPPLPDICRHLGERRLRAKLVYSHQAFLDVLPVRASKGLAIRYLANRWGLPLKNFLVAGDSGNDEEMLAGDTLGVVVANHSAELEVLKGLEQVYFAERAYAGGILEGLEHYGF